MNLRLIYNEYHWYFWYFFDRIAYWLELTASLSTCAHINTLSFMPIWVYLYVRFFNICECSAFVHGLYSERNKTYHQNAAHTNNTNELKSMPKRKLLTHGSLFFRILKFSLYAAHTEMLTLRNRKRSVRSVRICMLLLLRFAETFCFCIIHVQMKLTHSA